ncbi:MAG: alanine/ornithine racemase family PLP-dependent enzyme [Bacteroidetes bacterium]|nr:MAG: alanine/ornithine racemase family PLP-dependent enzyme [Bacteroidota bacterium]
MAEITISSKKLRHNFEFLKKFFSDNNIEWGIVSKLLCGNEIFLKELIHMGAMELMDSRISNLKKIKKINPEVNTVYIKPPPRKSLRSVITYADVSFNSDLETLRLISKEAGRQGKVHRVIIMIEMGDLREGVLGENLVGFYEKVFELPNIEVVGFGTNFNCMYGVMPSNDKMVQLSLYKQIIELKFNRKIKWISGGSSVAIPMIQKKQLTRGINHFRVGETLYFGNNLVTGKTIKGMKDDVITLYAEIIELLEKPIVPEGELAENPSGEMFEINPDDYGKTSWRALLDIGLLDISPDFLIPTDKNMEIAGASSDIVVIDLGRNPKKYKVGDYVKFKLKYMGALALFNSDYINKRLVD